MTDWSGVAISTAISKSLDTWKQSSEDHTIICQRPKWYKCSF